MTLSPKMTPAASASRSAAVSAGRAALRGKRSPPLCVLLVLALVATSAMAQEDPCAKFSWNIARERALFGTSPESLGAGHDAMSTPLLAPDRLYELQLGPQRQIVLPLPPGKKTSNDGAYAGLARLRVPRPGSYRISVDQPSWIDVVADGKMIDSADFQGRSGCLAPHKIVQYSLPAGQELLLQLSGAASPRLRLTITRVEAVPTP
jgi:hypothetical protein